MADTHVIFHDTLSCPFSLQALSHRDESAMDLRGLIGQAHSCEITLPGGKKRSFGGLATRGSQGEATVRSTAYTLELRPWLWFLKLGSGCRVFQNQSVPEIVKAVAKEAGYIDLKESLTANYPKLEYAVQYNESDFSFVSRLLEEAGIFYYFTHDQNKQTMVLADSPQGCQSGPELSWLGENFPETPDAHIWNVSLEESVQPTKVRVDDYNYLTPTARLSAESGRGYPLEAEFGAGHLTQSEGETVASRRLDGFENAALELTAESSHSGLSAGMIFTLKGHPEASFNKKWLVTELEMTVEDSGRVRARLRARPGDQAFRPPRRHPRPRIFGPLTGVVCGKAGEEIWTDEHGRVKVRFHWDHQTPADEKASAWLRVAQPWAGPERGALFLPRVGDEVLIDFLGGDPDRPLVTASLYNAAARPPWKLPDERAVSGFKGQSGNEIHWNDQKDEERLYFHAQKLLEILAEDERRVTVKGEGGDSLTLEKGGRTVLIQKGGDSLKVKGDRAVSVEGGETRQVKKNLELTVDGNYAITIKGDLTIKAKNIQLESREALNAKSGTALEISAGTNLKAQSKANAEVKAGANLTLEGTSFKLSGKAQGEVNGGGMTTVKGGLLKLN